jgi:protein-S-isoprenylcysteine O-methyltransferase Ste14
MNMAVLHFISAHFITLCWWVFVLVWVVSAFWVKPIVERQAWTGRLATFAFLTVTFMLLPGKISWRGLTTRIWPSGTALRLPACTLAFMGLGLSVWSRWSLGANWSATVTYRQGHQLVERGPYRFVRHPMYTGFLLMLAGTAVAVGSVGALMAFAVGCVGTWWKLHREEAMLTKHFPEAYQAYKSRTKALLPFIL